MIVTLTPIQLMLGSEVEPLTVCTHNTVGMYVRVQYTVRVEISSWVNFTFSWSTTVHDNNL